MAGAGVSEDGFPRRSMWFVQAVCMILIILALYQISFQHFYAFLDDDFISFVYSRNLARGDGLVWNPGEKPVEGYTNFLWVVFMAPFIGLGFPPYETARYLGGLFGLIILLQVYYFTSRLYGKKNLFRFLPLLFLVLSSNYMGWVGRGMDTPFYMMFLTYAILLFLSQRKTASGFWFGVAFICRQEASLVVIALVATDILVKLLKKGSDNPVFEARKLVYFILAVCILAAPFMAFRLWYYGHPFPNTYYAKAEADSFGFKVGWDYVKIYSKMYLNFFIPLLGLVLLIKGKRNKFLSMNENVNIYLFSIIMVYFGYMLWIGGDVLGHPYFRYLTPIAPVAYLLASNILYVSYTYLKGYPKITVLLLIPLFLTLTLMPSIGFRSDIGVMHSLRGFGLWLNENIEEDATIAVGMSGTIPYYADRNTIDLWGLNDEQIAHRRMDYGRGNYTPYGKYDPDYVISRRPDYILTNRYRTGSPEDPGCARMLVAYSSVCNHPEFSSLYRHVSFRAGRGFFHLYKLVNDAREVVYLSDLPVVSWEQSYGELIFDGSVDSGPIVVGDRFFVKGLGTHSDSEIVFDLNGVDATSFEAFVGLDDESSRAGSVVFKVYGDSMLIYDSGIVEFDMPVVEVVVDVSRVRLLRLVVESNGSRISDHADWADAKLVIAR